MKVIDIKKRASEVLTNCQPQLVRTFIILMLIKLIPSLFSNVMAGSALSFLSLIITFLFITVDHGYIVSSLKAVRNNAQNLTDDDALVGFKRYKELFFTYFLISLIIFGVIFAIILVLSIVMIPIIGMSMTSIPRMMSDSSIFGGYGSSLALLMNYAPMMILYVLFIIVSVMVAAVILSIYLFPAPYLLEQYHIKAGKAISESFSMMKGHALELFKLMISFFGWMLLTAIIQGIVAGLLSFLPVLGDLIAIAISSIFAIYTYSIRYSLSQAVFFEELAYYRYESQSQQTPHIVEQVEEVDVNNDGTI